MPRHRPSLDRLRRFADEHLLYEAGMLYDVTAKLMNRHQDNDLVVRNALLESFGVHNRNLIDFLWLDRPMRNTDAIAQDWIESWIPPEMSMRLANVKHRVGKEMLHLSYNRLDVPKDEKGWIILGIGPEVVGAFAKFAAEVPDDRVSRGWRNRAYSATGTISPESAKELERYVFRPDEPRSADLLSVPTQGLSRPEHAPRSGRGRADTSSDHRI